ncbi:MAG: MFS transporter [Alphaproteobacteria bacterium]|nr:MFS transporter [Alphaproteobacteria bacterium]
MAEAPDAPRAATEQGAEKPWRLRLFIITLAHAFGTINLYGVMALGPPMQAALSLTRGEFGLLSASYAAAMLCLALPIGATVERVGVRRSLFLSHVIGGLGIVVLAFAHGLYDGMAWMALSGVGYALVNPSTAKAVMMWVPVHRRGLAMGLKQTGVPIGGIIAGILSSLSSRIGLEALLIGIGAASILTGLAYAALPEMPPAPGEARRPSATAMIADMRTVLGDGNLRRATLVGCLFNGAQQSFIAYLTTVLTDSGAGTFYAALCFGLLQGASAVGRVVWGWLSDRRGGKRRPLLIAAGIGGMSAFAMFPLVGPGPALLLAAPLTLLAGGSLMSYAGLQLALVAEAVPVRLVAAAIGFNMLMSSLGNVVHPPVFGAIVDRAGYGPAWMFLTAVMAIAVAILALSVRERARPG